MVGRERVWEGREMRQAMEEPVEAWMNEARRWRKGMRPWPSGPHDGEPMESRAIRVTMGFWSGLEGQLG